MRQGREDLTLIRMTPDLIYDQMIGMGTARKLVSPGAATRRRLPPPLPRRRRERLAPPFRDRGALPRRDGEPLRRGRLEPARSPSCAGYVGTDLPRVTETIAPVTCPFTGEELMAVPALNPDVSIIHAQQADGGERGDLGHLGIQKEAVLSARRAIVTVEEVVEELTPHPSRSCCRPWPSTP
jgi:glutaconate CoA-transferase subunit A